MSIKRIFIVISAIFAVSAVFADNSSVTSKKYVDDLMSGYQGKLPGSGANKLMIYDDEDGIGEKSIAATLGNSASATSVPTVGAVKTGLDGKQDTITGTAGYVMTGTDTPGEVGERAIYSANTNYTDSLVTAESVNNGVINAVNHSLRRVNANGELDNNGTLWEIADTVVALSYLPTGYTQLEYIESDGTQSIDTGVLPSAVDNIYLKFKNTATNRGFLIGAAGDTKYNYVGIHQAFGGYGENWGSSSQWTKFSVSADTSNIHTIEVDLTSTPKFYFDEVLKATQDSYDTITSTYTLIINDKIYGSNDRCSARYYEVKLSKNGSLVRNFIPAQNSNGVVGLYDTVSGTFFTNSDGHAFIAGPPVGN